MPFIPIYNVAKFQNYKDSPKIAKVINNNDPKMLGRIKVELPGMYEPKDSQASNLPWIRRMQDTFLCGSGEMFSVPEEGSYVELIWPYDNRNAFYRGLPYGEKNKTGFFTEDYPNEWGFTDGTFVFKVNKITHEFIICDNTISIIRDKEGKVTINANEANINSKNVNINGSETVNITSSNITLGNKTQIDGKDFLSHTHGNGNEGSPTTGVL